MEEKNTSNSYNTGYIPLRKHRQRMIRLTAVIILLVVIILSVGGFTLFKISTGGRLALREAKNIRLALVATDIELYPSGGSIYAPERASGLAPGVLDSVKRLADVNGELMLSLYDRGNREIEKLTYKTDRYLVTYSRSEAGKEAWTVDYLWKILDY